MKSRIEKWAAKLSGDNRKRLYDSQKDTMVKLESKASEDLVKIEVQIKSMAQGYPALHLPYYIIFGKEIYSKQNKFKGQTLLNEIIILEEKWERRGLDPELLDRIKLFYVPAYIKMIFVMPVGIIEMYGAATAPTGWLLCNGAAVSRETYAALFAVISTTYGIGDGATTFNVPNFASKFPRGNTAGATGGSDNAINVTHTHTNSVGNQSVSHTHTHDHGSFNSGTVSAWHTHSVTGGGHRHGLSYGVSGSGYNCLHDFSETRIAYTTAWTRVDGTHTHTVGNPSANHYHAVNVPSKTSGNQSASHNHTVTIDSAGANGTNANIPAYLGVNFIIKY